MNNLTKRIVAIIIITLFSILVISTEAFAKNDGIQIVKADGKYLIYVKDFTGDFKFATSEKGNLKSDSLDLNYINSVKDAGDNSVVVLKDETAKYLYLKKGEQTAVIELDFTEAIDRDEIADIEEITNIIKTEIITINQRDEQIDQVKYEETVGGIEIKDDKNAEYQYVSKKLPADNYTEIKDYMDKLNNEYKNKDIYSKIEFLKEFKGAFDQLIKTVTDNNEWTTVENMKIAQENDAQKDDKYLVLLKKVSGDNTTYDAKLMTSDRTETAPEKVEEEIPIRKTIKLPNTGESLVIFAVLAGIVIAIVIVFVRMKSLKNKDNK